VTIVSRTGWHEVVGRWVFVLPEATIGPRGCEAVILDGAAHGPYEARGSLKDWQAGVGTLASGHVLPILAISAALAGPLLHLAGQEGGGVHFQGPSSRGKTTLLQAAASVWGRGASPGYVRAWRATANGLEGAAASATDTVLILDEFGQVDGREAGAVLYSLSNGGGKVRAARDGAMREPKSWRVMVLSTGEITVESKLTEDRGRKPRAGQSVRMLDIPADRGFGVFDYAGPDDDAGKLAKAFKQAAMSAYGFAGPEFVRRLIDEAVTGDDVRGQVGEFLSAHVPPGADGQVDRAAQRFGLIAAAGELATLFGVTPWREGAATAATAWALDQWISQRGGTEPAEARQAVEQVRRFIEAHGEYRFEPLDNGDARDVPNRAGWRKGEGGDREWFIPSETWRAEICAGLDSKFVARTLADAGILRPSNDGNQQVRRIDGKLIRVYVIGAAIFDGGEHED
jgi:putative DNA primase/helicase